MKEYFTVQDVKSSYFVICFLKILLISCIAILSSCNNELNICFTGDLLLDRGVREQINKKGVTALFTNVSSLFAKHDAVVVNLECPVTQLNSPINKRYIFRGEPEWLPALESVGITHAALANNHTCDQGREGIESTSINLIVNGIIPLGAGCNEVKACSPVFVNKGNIKVALFNSVLVPLENWVYLSDSYGICQSSVDELCDKIQNTKMVEKKCHVVIILHWGAEYAANPMPEQRYFARKLIDAGADVIIGHHPHVIQPTEIYKDKYIFYSLGNFVFDAKREIANIGILASLTFKENEITAKEYRYTIEQCVPLINEK